jgi:ammonia channel protein AmtB
MRQPLWPPYVDWWSFVILIQTGVVTVHDANPETLEVQLEGIAVVICWLLVIGFFVKKLLKKTARTTSSTKRDSLDE